jgi:hypothetical protein
VTSSPSQNAEEPPSLLRVLASVVSGALFGLFLSRLRAPVGRSTGAEHGQNTVDQEPRRRETEPSNALRVVVESLPSAETLSGKQRAREARKEWYQWGMLGVQTLTLGAVVVYACLTYKQWRTMQYSFNESQHQTRIYQQQLETAARPWIKIVGVKTRGDGAVVPALSFQKSLGNQQATFQLDIAVRNIGHSVADLAVRFELFFPMWKDFGNAVPAEERRFCESPMGKALPDYYPKFVLFPDEPFDWYGAGASYVDASNTNHFPQLGDQAYVIPVVIVCANYRLGSLPNPYQTSAVFEVFRTDNRTRFFEAGVGVPAKRIFLLRNELLDDAY